MSVYFREEQLSRIPEMAEKQGLSASSFVNVATLEKLKEDERESALSAAGPSRSD